MCSVCYSWKSTTQIIQYNVAFVNFHIKCSYVNILCLSSVGYVGGTVACQSALTSAGTLLTLVRAPTSAPRPGGGPKSLRSPCCGLAIYKNPTPLKLCSGEQQDGA
ncbi:hypothetical protein PoB_001004500 [Plakobranchus ocellatus]|uniref:Uncharacterized protein n=1 Tax=Plakobranchus ocellatus TaxID=259542 RepID=A0AAV3YKB5_9GAST|nr:hypothetical protein PoB_001004500 [Plakobranchus ocellatus]